MTTAAHLLEKLGTPPPDVCLDWSLQLQSQCNQIQHPASSSTSTPLSWDDLEVSDTGLLSVTSNSDSYSAQVLIDQLMSWSRSEREQVIEESRAAVATLAMKKQQRSRRKLPSTNDLLALVKRHRIEATIGGTVCLLCLAWMISQAILSSAPKSSQLSRSPATENSQAVPTSINDTDVSEADLAVANMEQPPSIADVLNISSDPTDRTSPQLPSINLSDVLPSSESVVAKEANESLISSSESVDSKPLEADGAKTEPPSGATTPVEGDVMRDVTALVQSAESHASESDLQSPASDEGEPRTNFEAIVLKTSPMLQTHLLPSKVARPRDPVWFISIIVDDEFTVQPNEPQRVTDRQAVTWLIGNVDAKSPTTKIAIQARAAPGKKVGLQWRIAAVSDEMPELALPVAKELQLFQQQLLSYIEVTRRESDQLTVLGRSADKETRSIFSKRRAALDAQNKLASRIAAIAENAAILDDSLRSQVTLHVDLFEGDRPNAQRLLRFGDAERRAAKDSTE